MDFLKKHSFHICLLIGLGILVCLVLLASVPPVSRDALTHHLIVPRLFLENGGIYEIPYIEFSYYPMNLDLLYMIPLAFGNDIAPKYIHLGFAVFTAILIFQYLKKQINKNWAILGALFFMTVPIIVKLSITVYVDLGLIFFSTASILQILKWRESDFSISHLWYAGIFCGLALGTKYNGLVTLFILTMMVISIYSRSNSGICQQQFKAIKYGVFFCAVSLIVFSPWAIKNMIWTGNPVYPLYENVFSTDQNSEKDLEQMQQRSGPPIKSGWNHLVTRKIIYGEKWWETFSIPIRIFFQGRDNDPKFFDGVLSPFLLILPLFSFLKTGKKKYDVDKFYLFLFSALFILVVFVKMDMRIRWLSPVIPPLVILSIFGLKRVYDFLIFSKWAKIGGIMVGLFIFAFNINYLIHQFYYVSPLEYLSGNIARAEYINMRWPEYSAYEYANKNLDKNSTLLALFLGNRRYYCEHKMIFGYELFKMLVEQSKNIEILEAKLRKKGFTHIIVSYDLFNRMVSSDYSDSKKDLIRSFFAHKKTMYSEGGIGLYSIN